MIPLSAAYIFAVLQHSRYRLLYSALRQAKPGPKGPSRVLIQAIVEQEQRERRSGCRRITRQTARTFGIDIDKDMVKRFLANITGLVPMTTNRHD